MNQGKVHENSLSWEKPLEKSQVKEDQSPLPTNPNPNEKNKRQGWTSTSSPSCSQSIHQNQKYLKVSQLI